MSYEMEMLNCPALDCGQEPDYTEIMEISGARVAEIACSTYEIKEDYDGNNACYAE